MIPSIKGIIAETNAKAIKTFFILKMTKTMILIPSAKSLVAFTRTYPLSPYINF